MAENEKNELTEGKAAEVSKKEKKTQAKKKPNIFVRMGRGICRWCREMKSELKKVQWPSAKQTTNNTLTVICCVVVIGVCIWLFDWLAAGGAKALIALAQS